MIDAIETHRTIGAHAETAASRRKPPPVAAPSWPILAPPCPTDGAEAEGSRMDSGVGADMDCKLNLNQGRAETPVGKSSRLGNGRKQPWENRVDSGMGADKRRSARGSTAP